IRKVKGVVPDRSLLHDTLFHFLYITDMSKRISLYWILDTGYWILDTGYWLLVTGYWLLVTGYWMLKRGSKIQSYFVERH
ncbi:MAG TPA: hypothetical protein VEV87_07125, partial [Chitinophagaceae bacterium]|nr:hypothetical protein [Chitinophagaceae bacterium]